MGRTYTQQTGMIKKKRKRRFKPTKEGMIALGELFLIIVAVFLVIFLVIKGITSSKKPGETTSDSTSTVPVQTTEAPKPKWNAGYISLGIASSGKGEGNLVLVNNDHEFMFPSKMTSKLTELYGKTEGLFVLGRYEDASRRGVYLNSGMLPSLRKMCEAMIAANKETLGPYKDKDGKDALDMIMIASGFRSKDYQQNLLDDADDTSFVAKAGCSEHHTGLAIDMRAWLSNNTYPYISQSQDPSCVQIYNWINTNCYKYGFVRRYPESKASITKSGHYAEHYRYVGYPHALAMMRNDLALEEYLTVLATRHRYDGTHYILNGDNGVTYEIYYVPAATGDEATTSVPVPMNLPYTVSGNNYDGFIVTVTRS